MQRYISLAITHYNSSEYIYDAIFPAINDDRISEIIICDDSSRDINNLKKLVEELNCNKIKLFINTINKGCYDNKIEVISKCTNEWAILLDSDNVLSESYVDTLFKIPEWNQTIIYAPSNAITFPEYPPSELLNFSIYENTMITKETFLNEIRNLKFLCLTNNCNYFLPVKTFLNCMKPLQHLYDRRTMDCQDSLILFSDWLCNNNTFYVVKDLHYKHRLRPNSNYMVSTSRIHENENKEKVINKVVQNINS